jgi:hypothetical protein
MRRLSRLLLAALLAVILLPPSASAQTISLSGFLKADYIYDTRQVLDVRGGHFHLVPLPGPDHENPNLNFAVIQSRIGLTSAGTQAFDADIRGYLEADFFGASNATISHMVLRRAFALLDWGTHEVLLGQDWSPMFTQTVFPQVIGFNTGAPFQPFARFGQATLVIKPENFRLIGSLSLQRDQFSEVPGPQIQHRAALPGIHAHAQYIDGDNTFGAGAYLKWIRPELGGERVASGAATVYSRILLEGVDIRAKAVYGSNMADHLMGGGYVRTVEGEYEPLQVASAWLDLTTRAPLAVGLFAGYLVNMGAAEDVRVLSAGATRFASVDNMLRFAPRIWMTSGRARLAFELEYTSALYTSGFDSRYRPERLPGDERTDNVRAQMAFYYFL